MDAQPDIFKNEEPEGISTPPSFMVGNYSFYPEQKMVGVLSYWIPPLSSGYRLPYFQALEYINYDSFKILDIKKKYS